MSKEDSRNRGHTYKYLSEILKIKLLKSLCDKNNWGRKLENPIRKVDGRDPNSVQECKKGGQTGVSTEKITPILDHFLTGRYSTSYSS